MAGRYRGSRTVPEGQRAPFLTRAGRWLARRGYDLVNSVVPGTVFDYREHRTINPRQALRDGSVAEGIRYLRGRPEGMSDEEWANVQREGRAAAFDTAWDFVPVPKIPGLTTARSMRRHASRLMGPNSRSGESSNRPTTRTVVPTVSGGGVTTTEKPVTVTDTRPAKPATSSGTSSTAPRTTDRQRGLLNNPLSTGYGGTRGYGVGVADSPADTLDMLDFSGGFGGVGYRGVTGGLAEYNPAVLEGQDLWNTVTGAQVLPQFSNGAYNAEHRATQSNRARF